MREQIESHGSALATAFLTAGELATFRAEVDRLLSESSSRGGVRNAFEKSARLRAFASAGLAADAAVAVLGPEARPVKLTIFDKAAGANWKVPWHQDLTISVKERRELAGFGPWSLKDGVPHVQPPAWVLERVVAVRIHLDDTPPENGALRVLSGTHRLGRIPESEIASLRRRIPETTCPVPAGGAMVMSPLLLHASSPAASPARRRVLHFEFSDLALPGGLQWA